jgi:glycosyltransferase involved in cell wall biosynthesis
MATGMMSDGKAIRALSRLAAFVYRRATAITVISPGFKRNLVDKGVSPDKVHVIPNWADEEVYGIRPQDDALAKQHGLDGRFNVMFGGNIGAAQGLQNLIVAAEQLRGEPRVQFVLVGDGVEQEQLVQMAQERGLTNVRFLGRQPAQEMARFYALADILLVHLKRDALFEITIPSKTLAYLACGRPILGVVAGDPADVIRQAEAGIICRQGDPAALAQTVRTFLDMSPAEREKMGRSGRRAFLAHYSRRKLMDRYEGLFQEISERNRRHRS